MYASKLQAYYKATILDQLANWHLPQGTKKWVDIENWIYKSNFGHTGLSHIWTTGKHHRTSLENLPLPIKATLMTWYTTNTNRSLSNPLSVLAPITRPEPKALATKGHNKYWRSLWPEWDETFFPAYKHNTNYLMPNFTRSKNTTFSTNKQMAGHQPTTRFELKCWNTQRTKKGTTTIYNIFMQRTTSQLLSAWEAWEKDLNMPINVETWERLYELTTKII